MESTATGTRGQAQQKTREVASRAQEKAQQAAGQAGSKPREQLDLHDESKTT